MNPNRITLITLGVRDLAAARAFYGRLGWRAEEGPPGVVFYDCGTFRFGLYGLSDLARDQGRDAARLGRGAVTLAVNWPDRAAVDAAFEAAVDAGATALAPPADAEWGGRSGLWADPDGHVWEYAFNPGWPLDAEGRLTST